MPDQLQLRGGTTAQHASFTGASKEVTVDTTKKTLVVHDGSTAGGNPLLREDQSNLPTTAPTRGIYNASGSLAISTNGTGRLFINSSGSVGIGGSPTSAFSVTGGNVEISNAAYNYYQVSATSGATGQFSANGNNSVELRATTNHPLAFYTNNTERLRITSAGLVGVGTSSPDTLLHLSLTSAPGNKFRAQGANNTDFRIGDHALNNGGFYINSNAANQDLRLQTQGTDRVTIDSSGRVGVGNNSPQAIVHATTAGAGQIRHSDGTRTIAFGSTGSETFVGSGANLTFLTNGLTSSDEKARIDTSGRLLVGTSTSTNNSRLGQKLAVVSSGGSANDYGGISLTTYAGSSDSFSAPALDFQRSRGTADGSFAEVVSGDALGYIAFRGADGAGWSDAASIKCEADGDWTTSGDATDSPGRLVFSTTADGASSPTERMRIKSNGETWSNNLIVLGKGNFTNYGGYISYDVTPDRLVVVNNSAGSYSGVALAPGSTSWGVYSDERLKINLAPIDNGLDKVGTLRAVTGRYKTDEASTSRSFLIAQDVQAVLPEAVSADSTEDAHLELRYTEVIPLLVSALKEAKERIETLEAKVAALETK